MKHSSNSDNRPRRRFRRVLTAGIACAMLSSLSLTAVYSVGLSGKPEAAEPTTRPTAGILKHVQAAQRKDADDAVLPVAIDLPLAGTTAMLSPDAVRAEAQALLEDGTVFLLRALSVEITADGAVKKVLLANGTVADALAKAGIKLGPDDLVFPAADTVLHRGTPVTVQRLTTEKRTEEQPIPFATKIVENGMLPAGESRLISAGKEGIKQVVYQDQYLDGKLFKSVFAGENVTKPAVDAVTEIGTGRTGQLASYRNTDAVISELSLPDSVKLDANGVPTNYQYVIEGDATAYTGDPATSTGRKPMPGHIAVDPREIPYGTEMYIVSADGSYVYGYAIAADTGGFIYTTDRLVDLYMDNEQMCDDWGVRGVRIYVL